MTTTATTENKVPRILVVDDTPDNLFLMNGLFEDRFEVLQAASGQEGLKIVMSDNPPDMVLLDIMMPDMDGYEVLRRIRQNPPTANIPVIFLTALATSQDERLGMNLGAVDYLTKPVNPELVVQRVEAHVRATAHARRMEALSEKLSRHLAPDAWQRLFHGAELEAISFEQKKLTVLFAETTLLAKWGVYERDSFAAEVQWLATRYNGTVDNFVFGATVVLFDDPGACLRMAMDLQRSTSDLRLRMGVDMGLCDIGTFRSGGATHTTLVGAAIAQAAKVAALAATGSIVISAEAYALVQAELQADTQGWMLTEEFHGTGLATAALTPTPYKGGPQASTFAGLGLS